MYSLFRTKTLASRAEVPLELIGLPLEFRFPVFDTVRELVLQIILFQDAFGRKQVQRILTTFVPCNKNSVSPGASFFEIPVDSW
jgi:hypothetical protein